MKVFISWSGSLSQNVGEVFRKWIPAVVQAAKPYFTPDDIAKSAKWSSEITQELAESKFGLIIITRENTQAPWLMFEAGAISKQFSSAKVCPILVNVTPSDLKGPLEQFQATVFRKEEIKKLMLAINACLEGNALDANVLDSVFEMWWPKLESDVAEAIKKNKTPNANAQVRNDRELLEEILQLSRRTYAANANSEGPHTAPRTSIHPGALVDILESYVDLCNIYVDSDMPDSIRDIISKMSRPVKYFRKTTNASDERLDAIYSKLDLAETLMSLKSVPPSANAPKADPKKS